MNHSVLSGFGLRFEVFPGLADAREVWKALESRCRPYPFQRLAWMECWMDTAGSAQGYSPRPVLVTDPAGRRALFPFAVSRRRGLRVLVWAGAGVSDYGAPIVEPGFSGDSGEFAAVFCAAGKELRCDAVLLEKIPALLADGRPNPACDSHFALHHVRAHSMQAPADMDAFFTARFGAKTRYNLRRAEKKLAEEARRNPSRDAGCGAAHNAPLPVLRVAGETEEGEKILDVLLSQKRGRYRLTREKDPFAAPGVEAFYREAWARRLPGVEISALAAGERIFAAHWGVREEDTLYVLLPSFESGEVSKHSPGLLLALKLIESCASTGTAHIDFTVGDEAYKEKLCSESMELRRYSRGTSLRGKLFVAFDLGKEKLKRNPAILGCVRLVRKKVREMKENLHGNR